MRGVLGVFGVLVRLKRWVAHAMTDPFQVRLASAACAAASRAMGVR